MPAQAEVVLPVSPVNRVSMAKLEVEAACIREADRIAVGADSRLRLRGFCGASFVSAEHLGVVGFQSSMVAPREAFGCQLPPVGTTPDPRGIPCRCRSKPTSQTSRRFAGI